MKNVLLDALITVFLIFFDRAQLIQIVLSYCRVWYQYQRGQTRRSHIPVVVSDDSIVSDPDILINFQGGRLAQEDVVSVND